MADQQQFQPREPTFVTLDKIRPREHCRNVYVKIVKVTHSTVQRKDGQDLPIADGFCADETKYLPFRVSGKYAQLLQVGNVVAFRNSRSEIFAGLHRLSIDRWGKITVEDRKIESAQIDYKKTKVADLQPGVNGDNVFVKIITVKQTEENGRKVAEGTCGDDSAVINFRVVGQSAPSCEEGKSVLFVNAKSEVYEEIHRLGSGPRGRVVVLEEQLGAPNTSKNMSDVKYEKIVLHSDDEKKPRNNNDNRRRNDNRDRRDNRDNRDNRRGDGRRDNRDNRDNRDRRDNRDNRDNRDRRDNRDNRDNRDRRDNRDNNRNNNQRRFDGKRN